MIVISEIKIKRPIEMFHILYSNDNLAKIVSKYVKSLIF